VFHLALTNNRPCACACLAGLASLYIWCLVDHALSSSVVLIAHCQLGDT